MSSNQKEDLNLTKLNVSPMSGSGGLTPNNPSHRSHSNNDVDGFVRQVSNRGSRRSSYYAKNYEQPKHTISLGPRHTHKLRRPRQKLSSKSGVTSEHNAKSSYRSKHK